MYDPAYNDGPFSNLFSIAEAAELWCIDESTIRKAIADGRLKPGKDCRKFGKQWVVTYRTMSLHYGIMSDANKQKFGINCMGRNGIEIPVP